MKWHEWDIIHRLSISMCYTHSSKYCPTMYVDFSIQKRHAWHKDVGNRQAGRALSYFHQAELASSSPLLLVPSNSIMDLT